MTDRIESLVRYVHIESMARRMYTERAAERGPAWDQLGAVTRSVWLERAQEALAGLPEGEEPLW